MIEEYLRKEKTHKHLIFVLNKVGLVEFIVNIIIVLINLNGIFTVINIA